MTGVSRARIEPAPNPEEAAAIVAALEALRAEPKAEPQASPGALAGRSRWRLSGLLGHSPRGMEQEDSLWSYTRWEDVT
ncbi:MAG: hypothetical protein M3151_00240 [Actinomycetota bacterium]|nr:hypothetical protein [Actinomycetota bacterium]